MNPFGRIIGLLTGDALAKHLVKEAQCAGAGDGGPINMGRAIELLSRAIEVAASTEIRAQALYMRAWAWRYESTYDQAMADYCEMIELTRQDAGAHFQRALTYLGHDIWFDNPETGPLDPDLVRRTGAGREMAISDLQIAARLLQDEEMKSYANDMLAEVTQDLSSTPGGIETRRQRRAEVIRMQIREYNVRLRR